MNDKQPEPSRRPRLVTTVAARPGRYRRRVDMTAPGASATLPAAGERSHIKVQVGLGLRTGDLPQTVAAARQLRHVAVVEILGQTRKAVEDARKVFTAVWDVLDRQAEPGGEDEAGGRWMALLLAVQMQEAAPGGGAWWAGRTFADPGAGGGIW